MAGSVHHLPFMAGSVHHLPFMAGSVHHLPFMAGSVHHLPFMAGSVHHLPFMAGSVHHLPFMAGSVHHLPFMAGSVHHLPFMAGSVHHLHLFSQICESILDHCLAPDCRLGGVGCDNMTVIIVCFLNGCGYSDLAMRCGVPVQPKPSPTHQFSEDRGRPRKSSTTCETSRDIEYACPIQPAKLDKFESHNGIEDSSPNDLYDECAPDPDIAPETSV